MFGSMGTASEKNGAGNAISCNDITFPQPKTLKPRQEKKAAAGGGRCQNKHKIDIF